MSSSRAIYIDAEGEFSIREITETYTPTGVQSLISVKYSAINPADLRHYYDDYHSSVAGYEVCSLPCVLLSLRQANQPRHFP